MILEVTYGAAIILSITIGYYTHDFLFRPDDDDCYCFSDDESDYESDY